MAQLYIKQVFLSLAGNSYLGTLMYYRNNEL